MTRPLLLKLSEIYSQNCSTCQDPFVQDPSAMLENCKPVVFWVGFYIQAQFVTSIVVARFVLLPAFLYEGIRFLERRISQFSSQNAGNLTCYLA